MSRVKRDVLRKLGDSPGLKGSMQLYFPTTKGSLGVLDYREVTKTGEKEECQVPGLSINLR